MFNILLNVLHNVIVYYKLTILDITACSHKAYAKITPIYHFPWYPAVCKWQNLCDRNCSQSNPVIKPYSVVGSQYMLYDQRHPSQTEWITYSPGCIYNWCIFCQSFEIYVYYRFENKFDRSHYVNASILVL